LTLGQRVKAMLLLVLARRPRLLVLDEPTMFSGEERRLHLDPKEPDREQGRIQRRDEER
jgi:hypothetical protein